MSHERREGIPGYGYGTQEIARSPLTLEDLDLLKRTVMFSEEDERYLRMAGDVLEGQAGDILDLWYGFVGDNPHLIYYFSDARTGEPNPEYLARVRKRFSQWILDTCRRPYDQDWLDYHHEIALRHTRAKKNETDGAYDTPDNIPLRYIIAFVYPITATIKHFLEGGGTPRRRWTRCTTLGSSRWSCRSPFGVGPTPGRGTSRLGRRCGEGR